MWRGRRLTYAEVEERTNRFANYLIDQGLGARSSRDGLAGHESHQDHLALYLHQRQRVHRGDGRRLQGPGRAVQRQLPLRRRGAALPVHQLRGQGDPVRVELRRNAGRGAARPARRAPADPGRRRRRGRPAARRGRLRGDPRRHRRPDRPAVSPSPDDLYILYTGGTTGMPKGVLWRQADIYVAAMGGRQIGGTEVLADYDAVAESARNGGGALRVLCVPPFMHGAAQWAIYNAFTNGGAVLIQDNVTRMDPVDVLDVAEREGAVTILAVGDAIARPLIEEIEQGGRELSSLVMLVNGGAALNSTLKDRLLAARPTMMVYDAVGSSETGAQMSHLSAPGQVRVDRELHPGSRHRGHRRRAHPRPGAGLPRDGVAGPTRPGPARVPGRRRQDGEDLSGHRRGALRDPRRPGPHRRRRGDRTAGPRLGDDQLRRREDLRRGGRAVDRPPPGRLRRRGGRPTQREVGLRGGRARTAPARACRSPRTSCSPSRRSTSPATSCPRGSCSCRRCSAHRLGRPTTAGPAGIAANPT